MVQDVELGSPPPTESLYLCKLFRKRPIRIALVTVALTLCAVLVGAAVTNLRVHTSKTTHEDLLALHTNFITLRNHLNPKTPGRMKPTRTPSPTKPANPWSTIAIDTEILRDFLTRPGRRDTTWPLQGHPYNDPHNAREIDTTDPKVPRDFLTRPSRRVFLGRW
jgi:hypothetical protein